MDGLIVTDAPALAEESAYRPAKTTSQRSWIRTICSFPVVLAASLLVLSVFTVRGRLTDPDLWWHLKIGEGIWNTHTIPTADLLSYTTGQHSWTAHEWLAQVLIYGAYHYGGYSGLMLWLCGFTAALFISQYALCGLYGRNAKVALIGAMTTWLAATVGLSIRPHTIGYLLLTWELLVLHLGRTKDKRWLLLLPPLFAIWVNCHGSFFIGLLVLGVFVADTLLRYPHRWVAPMSWDPAARRFLWLAAGLSVVALFCNPIGPKLVIYPLDVMFNQPGNLNSIEEWKPPTTDDARLLICAAIVALIAVLALRRKIKLRAVEVVLISLGLVMTCRHHRMLFLFGVLIAPILTRALSRSWDSYNAARDQLLPNAISLAVCFAVSFAAFPGAASLQAQVKDKTPAAAVEFIKSAHLSGPMLNEYGFGGYLIWALPEHKVFIDGRTDIFEWTGVLKEYGAWALLQTDPATLLQKHHIRFCVLSADAPMARVLLLLPDWREAYRDKQSVVLVKKSN